jgi:eukaryotic-like serine/threonine-protein kinase
MTRDAVAQWRELSALFDDASEIERDARPAWLARLRAQGHPLVARLEQMLAAHDAAQERAFLQSPPSLAASDNAAALAGGDLIGPWRLLHPLGSGGMAEVWLAERHDGAFNRQVAIKLLHRHVSSQHREGFLQRFARERDILAALHHPHIASLFDAGVTPAGQPWLALEHVQGEPITAACDA